MSLTAALLVDQVISHAPERQRVLSLPIALRLLRAARPELVTPVLRVVQPCHPAAGMTLRVVSA